MPTLTKKKKPSARKAIALRKKRRRNPGAPEFHIEVSTVYGSRIVKIYEGYLYVYQGSGAPQAGKFIKDSLFTAEIYKEDRGKGIFRLFGLHDATLVKIFKDIWHQSLMYEQGMKRLRQERHIASGFAGRRSGGRILT